MTKSVLEYLKSDVNNVKEYYQIPLTNNELKYIFSEDPKLLQKLQDVKMLVPFEGEEKEEDESPFCLKLLKKGYLSNIEKKEVVSSDPNARIDQIQSLLSLYDSNLKAKDIQALENIISEVVIDEEELEKKEEEKEDSMKSALVKMDMPEDKKKAIAKIFMSKDKRELLKSFFNTNASEAIEKLIEKVEKFFVLRIKGMKLMKNEIANLPESLLKKISNFIDYEESNWIEETVPKSLEQYILIEES